MKVLRWSLTWILYAIGHGTWVLFLKHEYPAPEWWYGFTYKIYHLSMCGSLRVQGDGSGPWLDQEDDDA